MHIHIFKSVGTFVSTRTRLKREAMKIAQEKLCKTINAKRQSETFPAWMEKLS